MSDLPYNKYRAAMEILQRGRDLLLESVADDVLDQQENLLDGGFQFHEFLESQGARLHFLGLIMGHLEQSAELLEEMTAESDGSMRPASGPGSPHGRKRSKGRNSRSPKPRRQPPPGSEGAVDETPF
jgi:hypothetical protein